MIVRGTASFAKFQSLLLVAARPPRSTLELRVYRPVTRGSQECERACVFDPTRTVGIGSAAFSQDTR